MWPNYFPEQCPPAEARQDTLLVYRLVEGSSPTARDFQPTIVESPHRPFPPDNLCMTCGVSVFKDLADARRQREKYKPLREKKIARGTVMPADGSVLETGKPTHVTWWLQTTTPHARFGEVLPDVTN